MITTRPVKPSSRRAAAALPPATPPPTITIGLPPILSDTEYILPSQSQHDDGCTQIPRSAAGELACRPGSVHPLARAGGHPSGTAVAGSLVRSTREHRAGHPRTLAQPAAPPSATGI